MFLNNAVQVVKNSKALLEDAEDFFNFEGDIFHFWSVKDGLEWGESTVHSLDTCILSEEKNEAARDQITVLHNGNGVRLWNTASSFVGTSIVQDLKRKKTAKDQMMVLCSGDDAG